MSKEIERIVNPIVKWYQKEEKNLPWKKDKEPYHIWISEIMLQQTRIEAVKKYYIRFIKRLPNIEALANISEEELLKLWEGLGYYSRARNLKKAAIKIQTDYEGNIPETYQELLKLPGIGEYTAGAIASISFQEKVPAVDGNVLRVISRVLASYEDVLLAETKKKITNLLKNIMPEEAGDFNEGLMELGEKICIPTGKPLCQQCPIQSCCKAYEQDIMEKIPVRVKKSARKIEIKTVFILQYENKVAVKKREKKGLLADLYEFPNVEGKIEESEIPCILEQWNLSFKELIRKKKAKHVFTHIEWQMIAYEIEVKNVNTQFIWTTQKQRETIYPLPTAFKKLYDISNNP